MNGAKYREILDEKLLQSAQDLRLWFTFQLDNNAKHTAKTTQEWLRDKSQCPRVAQPEPRLEPHQTSLERPENSSVATLPSNKTELVVSHPRRPEAVIAAKGASTKHGVKGLNTYANVIFKNIYYTFVKMYKNLFLLCHYGVLRLD